MEEKVSKKAQKILIIFLLLMLLCTGISRGMASLTTPKVKVEVLSSQELANITTDYVTVEKNKKKDLFITIVQPVEAETLNEGDSIDIYNLSNYQNESFQVEKISKKEGMVRTTIPLSSENYKEGQMVGYTINHTFGSYYSCVPIKALRSSKEQDFLLVLEEKETVLGTEYVAKRVDVKVQAQDSKYAAIEAADLTQEDQIITESTKNIEKGDVVRLAEEN